MADRSAAVLQTLIDALRRSTLGDALAHTRALAIEEHGDQHLVPRGEEALHETIGASCRCSPTTEPVTCPEHVHLIHVHSTLAGAVAGP